MCADCTVTVAESSGVDVDGAGCVMDQILIVVRHFTLTP